VEKRGGATKNQLITRGLSEAAGASVTAPLAQPLTAVRRVMETRYDGDFGMAPPLAGPSGRLDAADIAMSSARPPRGRPCGF
jgi:hypothetical protein